MGSIFRNLIQPAKLKPSKGYLLKRMPDIFVKIVHGMTDMAIDCTEFMFSNYGNTLITCKAAIRVSPHGTELLFSNVFPGSRIDSVL